jgi:hypothetical protein
MRITESKLRSLVRRELLRESAVRPRDLLKWGMSVVVRENGRSLYESKLAHTVAILKEDEWTGELKEAGYIRVDETRPMTKKYGGPCAGAYEVTWSKADKGLGPLLYDISMEILSLHGASLTSDRDEVSPDARKVWDYYDTRRGDVEKIQLDNEEGDLTPEDPSDDCSQWMSSLLTNDEGGEWFDKSISRAFRARGTPTLDALIGLGILEDETGLLSNLQKRKRSK